MRKSIGYILALITMSCCMSEASAASDYLIKAEKLYARADYTGAQRWLEVEMSVNPKSAAAHYLMGNILLTKKFLPEAIVEYQRAEALDPTGPSGVYSRKAIDRLTSGNKPVAKPEILAEPDAEELALKRSVKKTSEQTSENCKAIEKERDLKIKQINQEVDEKVRLLEDEMNTSIAQNGKRWTSRGRVVYDPEAQNAQIRDDYSQRIKVLKDDGDRRTQEIESIFQKKLEAIEQSSLGIDKAYLDGGKTTGVKLQPMGSNLNVRNYESSDEPSGVAPTMMAEPGKLNLNNKSGKSGKASKISKTQKTRKATK